MSAELIDSERRSKKGLAPGTADRLDHWIHDHSQTVRVLVQKCDLLSNRNAVWPHAEESSRNRPSARPAFSAGSIET